MRKSVLSLALVLTLTAGSMIFGANHQSSGSSNSGSASQNSGSSSTSQDSNTTTQNDTATVDDKTLSANVNQTFAADKIFSTSGILAESKKGIVTLRGSLSSEAEMDRAVELAKGVKGVQSVDSQLVVGNSNDTQKTTPKNPPNTTTGNVDSMSPGNSPDTNSSALTTEDKSRRNDPTANGNSMTPSNDSITGDTQISKQIDAQLKADKHLTANQITAEVVNGNVVLRGNVSDKAEETRIIDMVKQTKGVTNVQSMLVLKNANPK